MSTHSVNVLRRVTAECLWAVGDSGGRPRRQRAASRVRRSARPASDGGSLREAARPRPCSGGGPARSTRGELQRAGGFLLIREKGAPRVDTAMAQAQRTDSGPALLVRPDGYIAWAGPDVRTNGPDGWYTAWRAWTGPSAEAVHARR
ncbi:aromatic-ring hydroxylase C-terminal domain-containing protein [Streptomyces antimycoticus]|uniref:aromatic-ring hydroxylase C-terminal domain-containing protein n=1 Tax=Streptomyces antimycoticus TaxID=68175 RepID=UPI0031EB1879